ncbi:MAG: YceD family protein [Pseudobdellovibrionaceae bacterium]
MRKDLSLKIKLTDIPEEGKNFNYTRKDPEAVKALEDLVGNQPFEISITLRPINHMHFEMRGIIQASTSQQCSRCAEDFDFKLKKNINEIMIPEMDVGRTERYAKTPYQENEGDLSSIHYSLDMTFDLGEYLHEVVALTIPENPSPEVKGDQCTLCPKKVVPGAFDYDETTTAEKEPSPFEVLKNLKM